MILIAITRPEGYRMRNEPEIGVDRKLSTGKVITGEGESKPRIGKSWNSASPAGIDRDKGRELDIGNCECRLDLPAVERIEQSFDQGESDFTGKGRASETVIYCLSGSKVITRLEDKMPGPS